MLYNINVIEICLFKCCENTKKRKKSCDLVIFDFYFIVY